MKTSIVKNVNSQGRLCLIKDFCEYAGIKQNDGVVISKGNNDNELYIISLEKVLDSQEVIAFSKVDNKYRIIIPKEIRQNDKSFELSVTKKAIIVRKEIN